jgi:MFS family permease
MTETRLRSARASVLAIFFLHGAVFATWVSRIPAVKADIGLSTGQLGLALLGIAAGCLIAMPVAGWLVSRYGSRSVTAFSSFCFGAALALPAFAESQAGLTAALCILGLAAGAMDVSMNSHAIAVERIWGRPLVSGFHAFFSIGGIAGAALGGVAARAGLAPRAHFLIAAVAAEAITLAAVPGLLPGSADAVPPGGRQLRMSRALIGLAVLTFCFFLVEGAIADWSALYLRSTIGAGAGTSAAGYAVFSAAMAMGRLCGDFLRRRIGPATLIRAGSVIAAVGMAIALAVPHAAPAILGFLLVGAGCSIVVPIVFAAAGAIGKPAAGAALAFVTMSGYGGLFAGPPLIGFVADWTSLRAALSVVLALAASGFWFASSARAAKIEHGAPALTVTG